MLTKKKKRTPGISPEIVYVAQGLAIGLDVHNIFDQLNEKDKAEAAELAEHWYCPGCSK